MRVTQAIFALSALGGAAAFTVTPSFGMVRQQSPLFMADAVAEETAEAEATPAPAPAAPKQASTGMSMADVRKAIAGLTAANFSETLAKIEPYLLNDAGTSIYAKSMRRISRSAKAISVDVPEGYAKEAACTATRRSKQNDFIQQKIAEAAAAEPVADEPATDEEAAPAAEEEEAPAAE